MPNSSLQKAKKRNLFLFFIMVLLAVAVYALKDANKKKNLIYLPIDIANLQKIIIHQDPLIVLKKENNTWFVVHGEYHPANKKAVKDIINMLSTPLMAEYSVSRVSLQELSLAPPNLMVQLNNDVLLFGALSPIEQMHYVQFKNKVYLANPFLQVRFSQTLDTFLKPDEEIQDNDSHSLHGEH